MNVNNLVNAFGGTLVNEDSTAPTIDSKVVDALTLLHTLATSGLTSDSLSNAQERGVRRPGGGPLGILAELAVRAGVDAGVGARHREGPGYAPFPTVKAGETPKVTLGGMNYAISSYSMHRTRRSTPRCACGPSRTS